MHDIAAIKANNPIVEVAGRYTELQRISANQYKAKHNPLRDEKTSSLVFYVDSNKYHDFGSGLSGDVVDLVQAVEQCSQLEAMAILSNAERQPIRGNSSLSANIPAPPKLTPEQLNAEFAKFEPIDLSNPLHLAELEAVAPLWLINGSSETVGAFIEDKERFLNLIAYDTQNKTLVSKWQDAQGETITYKRRRFNGGKWINRKGTSPNQTPMAILHNPNGLIFIVEGMRDALNALLIGANFVAIPTSAFSNTKAIKTLIGANARVKLVAEDRSGFKAMSKLNQVMQGEVISFTSNPDVKVDLADFIATQTTLKGVDNVIRYAANF